jgi:hypothetical protein
MQKRVLLRSDPDKGWIVDDPRGETAFEKAPVVIDDDKEVEKCLLSNNWFSIGCTFEPTQLEIEFRPNNEGYSLFAQKHFGQRMFEIKDTFWRYSRKGRELIVERDDGSFHNVHIELCREFKVAGSVTGGELSFYDVTLTLSQHILPLECGSVESFPKEYWGKPKSKPEVDAHG